MKLKEIVKVYPNEVKAKKIHWCSFCNTFIIIGEKYRKVRVPAHLPYSKATRMIPICKECYNEYSHYRGKMT